MTRWQIFSAVALRRLPEVRPALDPIQSKVQQIFSAQELALSRYSKHEMQHIEDKKAREGGNDDIITKETAQDLEDKWVKERSTFSFGPYDERLTLNQYLFLKQKFGSDIKDQWLLPQAEFDSDKDENLYDTARRALIELLNINTGFRLVSRVPSSVYSFKYPKKITESNGYTGAKVFFLKAHLDGPDATVLEAVDADKHNDRLKWLTRLEAKELLPRRYMTSFGAGLLHENRVDVGRVLKKASDYANALSQKGQLAVSSN